MAKEKEKEKEKVYFVKGYSYYSSTTKKATKGKYPSKMYEVGIRVETLEDLPSDIREVFKPIFKDNKKDSEVIGYAYKCKSDYMFRMFDKDNNLVNNTTIPNDWEITLALKKKHSNEYDCDFLSCEGIKFDDVPKPYNPFIEE